jgi:hypothetical protein
MGIVVPPIQTFVLESPPVKRHPKKKHPAPPQLPNGLEFPTSSKGRKSTTTSTIEEQNFSSLDKPPQKRFASMDSHVLHSMLTAMLTDKTLLYNNIVRTAHHPLCNSGMSPDDVIEPSLDSDILLNLLQTMRRR